MTRQSTLRAVRVTARPNREHHTMDSLRPRLWVAGKNDPLGTGVRNALRGHLGGEWYSIDVARCDLSERTLALVMCLDFTVSVSVSRSVPSRLVMPVMRHILSEHIEPGRTAGFCGGQPGEKGCTMARRWLREMRVSEVES
jgi:hypothetical protein